MKFLFWWLIVLVAFACTKKSESSESTGDTTQLNKTSDSLIVSAQSGGDEFGYDPDYYLTKENVDPSRYQLIDRSTVILIEANEAQVQAKAEQQQAESEKNHEQWEKARAEWESQPHDSTEQFMDEQSFIGSDGADDVAFYQSQAQDIFDELKIATITITAKDYVKLVAKDKREWIFDVRTNMSPNWTMILFNVNKKPRVVEATDITRERIKQYFF